MDNKYVVLDLILGILIGYILCKAMSGNNLVKDVALTHPGCDTLSILKSEVDKELCNGCENRRRYNRICEMCDSFSIPIGEPEWKKVCTSCYIDNKDIRRQCSSCLQFNIKAYDPSWKKICISCFKKSKN
jgi:hypothetical protein